ncbi:hypothetical protein UP09_16630 [Bradyrhizobium sp. LTSP885]|uniref:hypothetical protein n=1 Tax=Bradyrhizobium sp. LTSP885 TaxID=1619232 RepID=UPI0005C95E13|nr:hypothetical protein [Bradyrhizobium sp. LTSP885]KJC43971.1 hypothetical protein UP09_16630 [Bradyrhizobium sp. LTSP885]
MSLSDPPLVPPPPPQMPDESYRPPPVPPRSGCATAFMVLFGLILLLPGLCAILFGVGSLTDSSMDPTLLFLVLLGLLVGFAGVMLIRAAIKGPTR